MSILTNLVGQTEENTIRALKDALGVSSLEVVICESMEEFYEFVPRWARDPDLPPEPIQVQ